MGGLLITFEGGEGVGKSTQISRLAAYLSSRGYDVVVTREPGGLPGGEAIRHMILNSPAETFGPATQALLFAAARSDHIAQIIRPTLDSGKIVLCDRFIDSSRVYQGVIGNLDPHFMMTLERITTDEMLPDLTIILDLPVEKGLARAAFRRGKEMADRFERDTLATHELRRLAFLAIAEAEPQRCAVVNADRDKDEVEIDIVKLVNGLIKHRKIAVNSVHEKRTE